MKALPRFGMVGVVSLAVCLSVSGISQQDKLQYKYVTELIRARSLHLIDLDFQYTHGLCLLPWMT